MKIGPITLPAWAVLALAFVLLLLGSLLVLWAGRACGDAGGYGVGAAAVLAVEAARRRLRRAVSVPPPSVAREEASRADASRDAELAEAIRTVPPLPPENGDGPTRPRSRTLRRLLKKP